jgi:hypothetical protein
MAVWRVDAVFIDITGSETRLNGPTFLHTHFTQEGTKLVQVFVKAEVVLCERALATQHRRSIFTGLATRSQDSSIDAIKSRTLAFK